MAELARLIDRVVESDSTVLVQGENGTGKELVARAIHARSARRAGPFVVQNCSAFNDNLLDSELFGHKKGAFTGAIADKRGLFEAAHGGTFFLDEVGDMSAVLQVKLLRVLQERTFTAVGDTAPRSVDVRVIAATHRDLGVMVEQGRFREDLYYRINVITLTVPPLRERMEDLALLLEHFLAKFARGVRRHPTRACLARLSAHDWPGNVRELENEVERMCVLAGASATLGEELLSPRLRGARREKPAADLAHAAASGESARAAPGLHAAVEALERAMISEALRRHRGNRTRAAAELRISRRNLIRKIADYGLAPRANQRAKRAR